MLTAEIRVNTTLIGHLYIVNEGLFITKPEFTQYRYEYYEPDKNIITGKVIHKRSEGALTLIETVIKNIKEQ